MPPLSMITPASVPSTGAANALVPKNGIGIAFWIAGVPGSAVIVNVNEPSAVAAGSRRFRTCRLAAAEVENHRPSQNI